MTILKYTSSLEESEELYFSKVANAFNYKRLMCIAAARQKKKKKQTKNLLETNEPNVIIANLVNDKTY